MIVALVLLCAGSVISPGPNFAMGSRTSLAVSRRAAIGVAFGVATGVTVFMCLAMFGASAAIERVPRLQEAVRIVDGLILVYLAYRIFSAHSPEDGSWGMPPKGKHIRCGFPLGLSTSLSNPQPVVFFLAVFASSNVLQTPLATQLGAITACAAIEVILYGLVAFLLSRGVPRRFYGRYRRLLDLAFCVPLAALGLFSVCEGAGDVLVDRGGA